MYKNTSDKKSYEQAVQNDKTENASQNQNQNAVIFNGY